MTLDESGNDEAPVKLLLARFGADMRLNRRDAVRRDANVKCIGLAGDVSLSEDQIEAHESVCTAYLLVRRTPLRRPRSAQSSSVLRPTARMPWAASSSSRSSVSPVTPTAPITSPLASRTCWPPPSAKICSLLALVR